jgi:DNA-binding CsgD family transcriptional regulator
MNTTRTAALELCKQMYLRRDIHLSTQEAEEMIRSINAAQVRQVEEEDYNGPVYEREHDNSRLSKQHIAIFNLMSDGKWRTLKEIALVLGYPESSISAQLRHLRKPRFGSHTVNKEIRGERKKGLYQYQLIVNVQ